MIEETATIPVLRPLIGTDKNEITREAARIGTLETSIIPDQDCCTLFVPKHPTTHAAPAAVLRAEQSFDVSALVAFAVDATEAVRLHYPETAESEAAIARRLSC